MEGNTVIEKFIQIDKEICSGCGACCEACPEEAIILVDDRAELDRHLCTACEACLDACPNGAISAIFTPVSSPASQVTPGTGQYVPVPSHLPEIHALFKPELSLRPIFNTALTFIGSEVAPRLLDLFMKAIEARLTQPSTNAISTSSTSSTSVGDKRRGQRKHLRYRGGKPGKAKHKGRM